MEAIYPYMLTLHLLCAIIFLGFIFTDVVLLSPLKKALGDELADKIFNVISAFAAVEWWGDDKPLCRHNARIF